MKIRLAHSPDADDIFMYYAIRFGWVETGDIEFENDALDIETLNEEALKGSYDVTAISFALYPRIRDDYALLRTAVSFGEGYGPKLIKRKGERLKRRFRVALSGRYTTNAMLFRIAYPDARPVYMNFLEIERAVLEGEVDAGILIHESILDFDERLEVEREIWEIWEDLAGEGLPLPLGGMALRRSLPLNRAIQIEKILTDGVRIANARKEELSRRLEEEKLVRISEKLLDRYLQMYATEESVELSPLQLRALDRLFEIGYDAGFYDCPIRAEEYLIPREYEEVRSL